MKNPINAHLYRIRAFTLLLFAAVFPMGLLAQTLPVNGTYNFYADATYDGTDGSIRQQVSSETVWRIADGVTVTVSNNAVTNPDTGGVFGSAFTQTFRIEPMGTTGRVEFIGNTTEAEGAVFQLGMAGANLDLINVAFIGNQGQLVNRGAGHGGGAIRGASASEVTLTDVLFENNAARHGGGIFTAGNVNITSGTFTGNMAHSWNTFPTVDVSGTLMGNTQAGYGGAIDGSHSAMRLIIARESVFTENWARRGGGAINSRARHSVELWDTIDISDNFAGFGGAINDAIQVNEQGEGVFFKYTGTTGMSDYIYSGNKAKGSEMDLTEVTSVWTSGSIPFTPHAKGGGFYFSGSHHVNTTTKTELRFDIATGVAVQIGKAGNPSSWDSIATSDFTGTGANLTLTGTGSGRLILHADNSYFQGSVNVGTGSLIVGNQNASLGGAITVASGAEFGGSGTLVTHKQNDSVFADRTSLTLNGSATLSVGTDNATGAETLYVLGNVTGSNAIFNHNLFSSGSASKLSVENITLEGANTINFGLLATGTFTLMEWSGAGLTSANLSDFSLTIAGVANSPRSDAALSLDGNSLVATLTTINNLVMKWTGAGGGEWTHLAGAQQNWVDSGGSGEALFFFADSVVFDGVTDADHATNRSITIGNNGVTVADMTVTGTARYEFLGSGGIVADADAVASNAAFTPTGKLLKSGEGELVFANTGANTFHGGIEIAGGMITFERVAQLGSGTGGIVFSDSGTLHTVGNVSGVLDETLTVAAGKTAELMVDSGGSLAYGGTLASGGAGSTLRKTGEGALMLTGDNAGNTVAIALDVGVTTLAETTAAIGGAITVNGGATLNGVGAAGNGGSVKIASGGILEAGLGSAQSGTLTVNNLELTGGAVLRMDLFAAADGVYRESDRIYDAGTSAINGTNVIDLASFATGTFNLGNLTGLVVNGSVTLSGMELLSGGRITAGLSDAGGTLELVTTSDQSRVMTWTGNGGSTWNLAGANWTDSGAVNQYSYGDRVLFDDTSGVGSREIIIAGSEVRVADMTVGGNADYTFTGGDIHASADNAQDDGMGGYLFSDASGKLIKTGNGTLTLANAKNTFLGGVDLDGGAVVVDNGGQLATSATAGITFTGDATLRAAADLTIDDDIAIAAGKTGAVDSGGHVMTLKGTVSGAADAAFAKDGAGTVLLESDLSGFSGALSVRNGILRMGAEDLLTDGAQSAIVVDVGATLDLDGHNQSITNLTGSGEVALGAAELTYTVSSGEDVFAGAFTGEGSVTKAGDGKWMLSGASTHAGGVVLQSGVLGLANSSALGVGQLTTGNPNAQVSLESDGLAIANNIAIASGTLTLESNGRAAEFSGDIGGGTLVLEGTGTLTLSGINTYSKLEVNTPLAIARRAEAISGNVNISDGSVLEFRGVASGQMGASLTGDRVLFTDSTLSVTGQNELRNFVVGAGSHVTAASTGALGGANADIMVRDGGSLFLSNPGTVGHNLSVDGGTLVFGSTPYASIYKIGSLAISGTLSFLDGSEIRLGGLLHTGIHTAALAYGGITGMPQYDANQDGMFMTMDIVDGNLLRITAYNMALEPGKDIAAGIDAMRASMDAVYSHLNDELLAPMGGLEIPERKNSLWVRVIGSFAEHETDKEYLGYTDNTRAGVLGYDWISSRNLMIGGFAGYSSTHLKTDNGAITDIDLPVFGLYSALRFGNYYVSANLAYATGGADTERREELDNLVTGSYDLDSIGARVEVGRVFPFMARSSLRPSIGLHYTNLSFNNYAEKGIGAVRMDDIRTDILQVVVKLDTTQRIKMPWGGEGMIDLGLGWKQSINAERTDVYATMVDHPDARLRIRGDNYDNSTLVARLGLRMMLTRASQFALSYDYNYIPFGNHRNATRRDTFGASVRVSW